MLFRSTRTAAAFILGCKLFDNRLNIAGVILNQVGSKRQADLISQSIEKFTEIPVLGTIKKLNEQDFFPARHLGLITPAEYEEFSNALENARKVIEDNVDIDRIIDIAKKAPDLEFENVFIEDKRQEVGKVRIGYFNDRVFSFYYPDNIDALKNAGAEVIELSSVEDKVLQDVDGVYIGGGFPETNLDLLSKNQELMNDINDKASKGLPIYAECGGLMYMAKSIEYQNKEYNLCGVIPLKIKMKAKPVGHGYVDAEVDNDNGYFPIGLNIKAHEFHYSYIAETEESLPTCLNIKLGSGAINGRDGIVINNVFATYLHIHSVGCHEWAKGLVNQANNYKKNKIN